MRDLGLTIIGNLTADPQLRFTPSGAAVAAFTIAYTPRIRRGEEWTDGEPTFLDCRAWRQLAEHVAESLAKGHRVIASGNIETQRWEDKEDPSKKRSRMILNVWGIGPDLTYAIATVQKTVRHQGGPPDDPWATASADRPAAGFDDEPPF